LILLPSSSPPLLYFPPLFLSFSPPLQAEKQKADLTKELEDLQDKLEEQGGATAAQVSATIRNSYKLAHTQTQTQSGLTFLYCLMINQLKM